MYISYGHEYHNKPLDAWMPCWIFSLMRIRKRIPSEDKVVNIHLSPWLENPPWNVTVWTRKWMVGRPSFPFRHAFGYENMAHWFLWVAICRRPKKKSPMIDSLEVLGSHHFLVRLVSKFHHDFKSRGWQHLPIRKSPFFFQLFSLSNTNEVRTGTLLPPCGFSANRRSSVSG